MLFLKTDFSADTTELTSSQREDFGFYFNHDLSN